MDNITHSLVGLMLARAGLEKTTPHGAAMMVLAANAPDIDAVFWFSGAQTYLEWHRSFPHAIVFAPLVALLPPLPGLPPLPRSPLPPPSSEEHAAATTTTAHASLATSLRMKHQQFARRPSRASAKIVG